MFLEYFLYAVRPPPYRYAVRQQWRGNKELLDNPVYISFVAAIIQKTALKIFITILGRCWVIKRKLLGVGRCGEILLHGELDKYMDVGR